jgi:hypothetical protein
MEAGLRISIKNYQCKLAGVHLDTVLSKGNIKVPTANLARFRL